MAAAVGMILCFICNKWSTIISVNKRSAAVLWFNFFSSSLVSDRLSRTENIQKNKDQAHRLKGVLQDSIVMLEQVGQVVPQGCEWAGCQLGTSVDFYSCLLTLLPLQHSLLVQVFLSLHACPCLIERRNLLSSFYNHIYKLSYPRPPLLFGLVLGTFDTALWSLRLAQYPTQSRFAGWANEQIQ